MKPLNKKQTNVNQLKYFLYFISLSIILILFWMWFDNNEKTKELNKISNGKKSIVQIHDPG